MMRILFLSITALICLSVADVRAEEPLLYVGIIETPDDTPPDQCYQLFRNKKLVSPLKPEMKVFNGDVIVPQKGKSVKLVYKHTACGEKAIREKMTVNCKPVRCEQTGWFMELLSATLKIKRDHYNERRATPFRGEKADNRFMVSPWPVENASMLYGEPIYFRLEGVFDKAKLVIVHSGDGKPIERDIKMGELLCVREVFEAGASYKWYVETEGKKLSKIRQFRILDKTESDNIRSQMKEVAEKYKDQCPEIKQALYLQVISNMTPDLDLYPDSLRLMKEYKYNKKCGSEFGYISERIFEYGLGKD